MSYNIAIVVASFNSDINEPMLKNAEDEVKKLGGVVAKVVHVHGALDMPLIAKKLAQRRDIDGIVLLGSVIQGKTYHDVIVAEVAAWKSADISVEYDTPVTVGISGPRQTREDAVARIGKMDRGAVQACFQMLNELKDIEK